MVIRATQNRRPAKYLLLPYRPHSPLGAVWLYLRRCGVAHSISQLTYVANRCQTSEYQPIVSTNIRNPAVENVPLITRNSLTTSAPFRSSNPSKQNASSKEMKSRRLERAKRL